MLKSNRKALNILIFVFLTAFVLYNLASYHLSSDFTSSKEQQYELEVLSLKETANMLLERNPDISLMNNRDVFIYLAGLDSSYKEGRHFNPKGELLDPWGKPYIIQISKAGVIVRSDSPEAHEIPAEK